MLCKVVTTLSSALIPGGCCNTCLQKSSLSKGHGGLGVADGIGSLCECSARVFEALLTQLADRFGQVSNC